VSFNVPVTLSVTGVLHPLVHIYGTGCHHIYGSVKVSDNLIGCSRLICLVIETAAFCDISVRNAVYKSSYLLTYLLGEEKWTSIIFDPRRVYASSVR